MLTVKKQRGIGDRLLEHLSVKYFSNKIAGYRFIEESYLSQCRNQHNTGSCSFVSTVAAVEVLYRMFDVPIHNPSVKIFYFDLQEIFDNLYVKFDSVQNASSNHANLLNSDGTPVELVLEYVVRYGLQATRLCKDVEERDTLSCFNPAANKYKIKGYKPLTKDEVIHWAGIFPLIGVFISYSSLSYYKKALYTGPQDHEKQWKPDVSHAILVVGIFTDGISLEQFVVIQNSYGRGYGFNGFLAMPLDCQNLFQNFYLPILDDKMEKRISSLTPPPKQIISRKSGLCPVCGTLKGIGVTEHEDDHPPYTRESMKNALIGSTNKHLKCSVFSKFAADLPTLCPRILLSGPAGSEIYQETLVKALAQYFGAKILVVDSLILPGGPTTWTTDSIKESSKPERARVYARRTSLWLKKPASSVEEDNTGGSIISSQAPPKQEASMASSKNYVFKKGDQVKYVGSLLSGSSVRGPIYGYRGKVVLPFKESTSKIGVRFDKTILDGTDLGGCCEEDHGYLCAADHLCLNSSIEDFDKFAMNELLEVASLESKSSPLILFVKDIEKSVAGSCAAYALLKTKLENSPENLVVIDSHTQTDYRKEKSHPGGLLFTKFGSNQTELLDFTFPDNFGRLNDISKETPKKAKQLNSLLPNKVTTQIPQMKQCYQTGKCSWIETLKQ